MCRGWRLVLVCSVGVLMSCDASRSRVEHPAVLEIVCEGCERVEARHYRPVLDAPIPKAVQENVPGRSAELPVLGSKGEVTRLDIQRLLYQKYKKAVTDIRITQVALDFDAPSERLVEVFWGARDGEGDRAGWKWVFVLDQRKEGGFQVVKSWTAGEMRADVRVLAHGFGGRPALIATTLGASSTSGEFCVLSADGKMSCPVAMRMKRSEGGPSLVLDGAGRTSRIVLRRVGQGDVDVGTVWMKRDEFQMRVQRPKF